ncbi:MAG: divalent-cation tolerance protein CutA [Euryarchaeota archaeon]|nr:divalent-cation tolerance protein CutA [Euryarchaeota archaeon]
MAARRATAASRPVHVETTVATDEEAATLESAALDERLAACVQRLRVASRYRWKGRLEEADEVLVAFKTTTGRAARLCARILALHPYEVPYLRVERMEGVPAAYRAWLAKETAPPRRRARRAT